MSADADFGAYLKTAIEVGYKLPGMEGVASRLENIEKANSQEPGIFQDVEGAVYDEFFRVYNIMKGKAAPPKGIFHKFGSKDKPMADICNEATQITYLSGIFLRAMKENAAYHGGKIPTIGEVQFVSRDYPEFMLHMVSMVNAGHFKDMGKDDRNRLHSEAMSLEDPENFEYLAGILGFEVPRLYRIRARVKDIKTY